MTRQSVAVTVAAEPAKEADRANAACSSDDDDILSDGDETSAEGDFRSV